MDEGGILANSQRIANGRYNRQGVVAELIPRRQLHLELILRSRGGNGWATRMVTPSVSDSSSPATIRPDLRLVRCAGECIASPSRPHMPPKARHSVGNAFWSFDRQGFGHCFHQPVR